MFASVHASVFLLIPRDVAYVDETSDDMRIPSDVARDSGMISPTIPI